MAENDVKQSPKERLKEITDSIETGIQNLFESEKYMQYLKTMSRFHKYSLNNTMLISMQNPDATLVAGFNKWKDTFSRHVKKGEKGIKIIAPTPYKIKEEREKLDPITKAPLLDANGQIELEEVERQIPMFRVVSVFDVSQTYGEPLPTLANDLTGNVAQFETFMEAIKRTSPVPLALEQMPDNMDGYFHLAEERIAIREGMSEVQTISAAIHEMAHSLLHSRQKAQELKDSNVPPKDRNTEEVEAESISFAVCNYYGIETSDNSFGYIANWSNGKDLKELKSSLETINQTSSQIITGIDKHFAELMKEQEKEVVATTTMSKEEELAVAIDKFAQDFDPYEYNDQVADTESHINEIADNLRTGNTKAIKDFLTEIDFNDQPHEKSQADNLMKEIYNYEMYNYPRELAYKIGDGYLAIHDCDEGFDYSFYDKDYNLIDGGVYDDIELNIYEAIHEVAEFDDGFSIWNRENVEKVDFEDLTEKAENIELSKVVGTVKYSDVTNEFVISSPLFKDADLPLYTNRDGEKFVFGFGNLGNGTNVWNFLDETNNDYTNVAHISDEGTLTLLVDNLPDTAKKALEEKATEIRSEIETQMNMPDPNVTLDEMFDYGYTALELLPLSKERALELYNEDLTIYALYPDDSEGMVFELSEFEEHEGYFGIEVVDWENYLDLQKMKERQWSLSPQEEKAFVERKDESFAIYQLKSGTEFRDYRFTGAEELECMGKEIDRDNYNLIYTDGLQNVESVSHALDCLYYDFNHDKPDDFIGHSLSVSDIVAINMNGAVSYHYVDTIGFKDLEHFVEPNPDNHLTGEKIATPRGNFFLTSLSKEEMQAQGYGVHHNSDDGRYAIMGNGTIAYAVANENPLKNAEISTEQNFNMIDGTLNNQPTVAELEHDAKNGKPISLMDLLDATRREQKQQPKVKKEKQAQSKSAEMER